MEILVRGQVLTAQEVEMTGVEFIKVLAFVAIAVILLSARISGWG
jgi:hypothetical protein